MALSCENVNWNDWIKCLWASLQLPTCFLYTQTHSLWWTPRLQAQTLRLEPSQCVLSLISHQTLSRSLIEGYAPMHTGHSSHHKLSNQLSQMRCKWSSHFLCSNPQISEEPVDLPTKDKLTHQPGQCWMHH